MEVADGMGTVKGGTDRELNRAARNDSEGDPASKE